MDDTLANFVAFTAADVDIAQQYLESCDYNLQAAVDLYFASEGAPVATNPPPPDSGVRETISGFDDQLIDDEAQYYNEIIRENRRKEVRARKPRGIFNQDRDLDLDNSSLSRHERRLAELFRPPFDIISEYDNFEEAKEDAQQQEKLLLVNIQEPGEFVCQQLNRDLWRVKQVKEIVEKHFVFVQYDAEDPDGEDYRVLYPFDDFPHIAVIDPFTGEQQKVWDTVPRASDFIEDILDEVAKAKDEEREITPAPDSSAPESPVPETPVETPQGTQGTSVPVVETDGTANTSDPVAAIAPLDIPEPAAGPRIQLRFSDGSRLVRRFNSSDPVSTIYGVVKHIRGLETPSLTCDRRELKNELNSTIEEAKLGNATVLVE